jgi:uncharacterized RDD family membrane protein YckC
MYCARCGYNNPVTAKICKNCELDLQATATTPDRAVQPEELTYAGFWLRFFAAFLDVLVLGATIILMLVSIAVVIAFNGRDYIIHDPLLVSIFYWAMFLLAVSYHVFMLSGIHGATFGKRWMNIKVLDTRGGRLTAPRALGRLIARPFSYLLLMTGFLMQPFTPRKQALHDLIAGTIVIRANNSKKISVMASLLVLFFVLMVPALAIFSTVGLPIFQQRILNVQLEQGMRTGRKATLAVARFYHNNGRVPAAISDAADISASPHVSDIEINQQSGELILTLSGTVRKAIRHKHLIFTPTQEADSSISWKCHSDDIEARILPATCK